jgi:uncharacterized SAM-binding protein YcdF (DUF218 family)
MRPAVVIFGAGVRPDGRPSPTLRRRVEAAFRFGQRLDAPVFVPTGGVGRYGASEASVMAGLLIELGVPPERILAEETAADTLASVRAVARLLAAHGLRGPLYAATSAYHLPRCLLLLRLAGLPARACPPPPHRAAARFRRRWYWRLRELPAIPVDAAAMVWLRATGRF